MKKLILFLIIIISVHGQSQMNWINVDSFYSPLPNNFHVFKTTDSLNGKPNIAFYTIADLKDKQIDFTTDTSNKRRLTPLQFYKKNNEPLLVVNTTFFSFQTHQNLNLVIQNKKLLGYNIHTTARKGKDTLTFKHTLGSAFGINKNRMADIAWVYTDSSYKKSFALQYPVNPIIDSNSQFNYLKSIKDFKKWKVKTAFGAGPVLIQNAEIKITNNEELRFAGNAINDKHPRSAIGYTASGKIIVLVIQGRFPNIAEGATLHQTASILKDLGCVEAMNLDGGGSSCMLINGKETITVSDKNGQRSVPSVFIISSPKPKH